MSIIVGCTRPQIVTQLPSDPKTGDQVIYKHTATGSIGAHLPMIYDGARWQPLGEAVLCRWTCGSKAQTFTEATPTDVTVGDYTSPSSG